MMPFGLSLGGHMFHQAGGGALAKRSGSSAHLQRRLAVAAAATATASAAGLHLHRQGKLALPGAHPLANAAAGAQPQQLLRMPRELAEVICGAVGEIVQVAVLYPLGTIKVRCQAGGLPAGAVLQQLLAPGAGPAAVLRQLYAGVFGASVASVAVGSLYYFTFCAAKRAATRVVASNEARQQQQQSQPAAAVVAGAGAAATSSSSSSSGDDAVHHYPRSQGNDCHGFDPVFAAICSDTKQASAAAAAAVGSSTGTQQQQQATAAAELSSSGKLQANIMAACAAAVVGALVEAPVELFKHRAQAGQLQGSLFSSAATALRTAGPAALYGSFFLPFLLQSLPFDVGELVTYACANDWRRAAQVVSSSRASSSAAQVSAASAPAPALAAAAAAGQQQAPAWMVHVQQQPAEAASSQQPAEPQQQQLLPALGSLTAAALAAGSSSSMGGGLLHPGQVAAAMPDHVWDMVVGGTAGAAAVLISMPADTIKTVMETGGGVTHGSGGARLGSLAAFAATGRQLTAQHGAAGLFRGLAPRLVESVPSTALYWVAVECCRRLLEPHVAPEAQPAAAGGSSR